jgi:molybdopterin-guanine dinucleotide biosynthesis protein A
MIEKNDLTVSILAGGTSSRFGEPKELFIYQGQPLLLHALDLAKKISNKIMVITNRNNQSILPSDIRKVSDVKKNCGPLGGIYTALFHSDTTFVAVMPCDMPGLTSNLYERLYRERHPEKPVALASEKGVEPMVSIWPKALISGLKKFIYLGKLEMRMVLAGLDAKIINVQNTSENFRSDLFLNINSKKDLEPSVLKRIKTDYNAA